MIKGNDRGIALFLVLWVLALLMVIVGEFCHAMRTEVNVTRNFKEETEAYYIALAGINHAVVELLRNDLIPLKEGEEDLLPTEEQRWRVNVEQPPIPYGTGHYVVMLGNEMGKINLNLADEKLLRVMLNGFDLTDEEKNIIVDSIQDWRDVDGFHRVNGAEDDYYRNLSDPYDCKDGDFDSVDELLLVRGMTPEIFFGGLSERLTVFQERKPDSAAKKSARRKVTQRVNINAASPEVLLALPLMTEDLVSQILEYRKEKDFKVTSELADILGPDVYAAVTPYLTFALSSFYTVRSTGQAGQGGVRDSLSVTVELDRRSPTGYRLLSWREE